MTCSCSGARPLTPVLPNRLKSLIFFVVVVVDLSALVLRVVVHGDLRRGFGDGDE